MLISGTPVDDNKSTYFALQALHGVGANRSRKLCAHLGLRLGVRLHDFGRMHALSKSARDFIPRDLIKLHRDRVKFYINLKHYRGLRHMFALPCRGQRCRTNARTVKRLNVASSRGLRR